MYKNFNHAQNFKIQRSQEVEGGREGENQLAAGWASHRQRVYCLKYKMNEEEGQHRRCKTMLSLPTPSELLRVTEQPTCLCDMGSI